jgi:ubiquinone/menaquinone biosynthesis C-methylase UbiE
MSPAEVVSGRAALARKLAAFERVPRGAARVLDVGCGVGEDVFALAEHLGSSSLVVGIDVCLERIDDAQRALRNVALNIRFAVGDARSLPFADDGFDVVRADGLFQELAERGRAMRELSRVTVPGGRVLVHDVEGVVLAGSDVEDDLLALMRRAGLVSVELSEVRRGPNDAGPRCLTLMGIKPAEDGARGNT